MTDLDPLRYPIGKFERLSGRLAEADRALCISEIEQTPAIFRSLVTGLTDAQIDTPYRPGGWTIRQVVHHMPDSHINAYVRMKLAVTEDSPTIKPYLEARWAELADGRTEPIAMSLDLLEALHKRWVVFLRSLSEPDFTKTFLHPEMKAPVTLVQTLAIYSWHGRHHAAHIRNTRF